jgi:hypothetical protein
MGSVYVIKLRYENVFRSFSHQDGNRICFGNAVSNRERSGEMGGVKISSIEV